MQLKKEYYKPYLAATEPMFVAPRVVEVFERVGTGGEWVRAKEGNLR